MAEVRQRIWHTSNNNIIVTSVFCQAECHLERTINDNQVKDNHTSKDCDIQS